MTSKPSKSRIGRVFRGAWWLLDATRRTLLNLLLLVLLIALVWALWRGGPPALQPKTTLVLDLSGHIVEQHSGSLRDNAIKKARGQEDGQTRLRDVVAVLDAAAKDPDITQALLVLDGMGGAGLPKLREISAALQRFKAAGKPVVAWGSGYNQRQFYLAAQASEVWLHPMGAVEVQGYGGWRSYYKDLLDKVGVQANVFRAGKFKNANEAYAANAPSPETLEAEGALYSALWSTWTHDVEQARKQPAGSVAQAVASLPASLLAVGGDAAQWALQVKWVDALKTRDEMRAAMTARGAAQDEGKTFRQVFWGDYLARIKPDASSTETVGVIVAEGSIGNGKAAPGSIGGLSTAELIRNARDDDKIKALVLRVDSPGGSAFGSELVRRELELTRKAGKPVVVSMGDLAASGGYWISLAADEMIADEATITGSIGVIAMLPTAREAADKLGVRTGGVSTTWLAGAYDLRRDMDPRFAQLVQAGVDHTYATFTALAAAARKTTQAQINEVGQGRVWAGKQALERNLVDRLGGLQIALQSAAARAKLHEGYRVQYIETPPGRLERVLQQFGVALPDLTAAVAPLLGTADGLPAGLQGALLSLGLALGLGTPASADVAQDLTWLVEAAQQRQPAALAHCLCSVP